MEINNCADISEMLYYATHTEDDEEIKQDIQFDCLFMLDLVDDSDWIFDLMRY